MKKLLVILLLAVGSTACTSMISPIPYSITAGMPKGAPEGSPGFSYGWKHGCVSGMAAYGPMHHKVAYKYTYDTLLVNNDEYHDAWELGFRHYRWYINSWNA